jgi:Putative bacterial sensory transduction regulator
LFNAAGFESEVVDNKISDTDSVRMVRTQFWPGATTTFAGAVPIWCKKDNPKICNGISIFVNLGKAGIDSKWMNAWNSSMFFVRAYTLTSGEFIFDYQFPLQPGVTPEYIKTAVTAFKTAVDLSTDFKP